MIGTPRLIDYTNIGLIIISLVIAFIIPFQLFLVAYAVLGPLHYLTEINWLDRKKYFVNTKKVVWVFCVFAILFAFPYIFKLPVLESAAENEKMSSIIQFFWNHINALVFMALVISISLVVTQNNYIRATIIVGGIALSIVLNSFDSYNIWVGLFIPTVIHVFVFTILFIIYGALKSKSIPGYITAILALSVPLIILFVDVNPKNYVFPDPVKQTYLASGFHVLIAKLSGVLGLSDGNHFYFYEKVYLKIQIFLAFAYTYHYLNWYSKTSIIGWYKNMTTKRTLVIAVVWIVSVGIYWYDFQTGFLILLALSLLHVFVEFPLNIISIRGIIQEVKNI